MASIARILAVLVGLLGLCSGCASGGAGGGVPRAQQVAPGVYMLRGADGELDARNLGRLGNAGFIVGEQGVIAIDAGVSYRHGQALLAAIAQVTDQPVKLLLITHARQEFLFGAEAFHERGIPVRMQRRVAQLMTARCEGCLKTLNRLLGEDAMRGTTLVAPDQVFDESHELTLIGRPVRVLSFGHSSGPGDVAILDERSGVLFAGGLLDHEHVPDIQDSELPGWQAALTQLRQLPIRAIVPGHGPVAGPELVGTVSDYLGRLQARLIELLRADTALSDVADAADLPAYRHWDQYSTIHRRNAAILFVRMEREQLLHQE